MSQASPTIGANKSGLVYRQEDNDGKKALLSHHKGAAAPSYAEAGTIWLDDSATPWRLKLFDGSDWIALGAVHAGNNSFLPFMGAGALRLCAFAADSGDVNACAVSPVPAPLQHQSGQMVVLIPAHDVTGPATLALGDLDVRDMVRDDGSGLAPGDMRAGRVYLLVYDGTRFIVTNPVRADSLPSGSIVGSARAVYTTYTALTAIIPHDNTIPQPTEGTQILSTSLTPQHAENRVRVRFSGFGCASGNIPIVAFLSTDGGAAVQAVSAHGKDTGQTQHIGFEFEYVPGDTEPHTYSVRIGPGTSGNVRMNGTSTARLFGGVAASTLTVEEIQA